MKLRIDKSNINSNFEIKDLHRYYIPIWVNEILIYKR